ncbi:hypothetical protein GCM10027160_50100 [Streptomyces calidiresistens]|uniref:Guanylate cyclase domain-containing protein n=1 Tax=Streptomyces calidiresistens TaxID=1485586 RepID=A0A7W3XY86_9ACTN|nr:hypothetical protein [Streptomyces calidiresistens]MBB0231561.1 hypothetical protein [Streptomyces calidiresistens]
MDLTPQHHPIVILDIVGSGRRTDPDQSWLRERLYAMTERALRTAGIEGAETEDRGDGILALLPGGIPKTALLGPFVDAFDAELRAHARLYRTGPRSLRLRAALHAGEVARDERGWVGADLNTAFRMVDLPALRGTLETADRAVLALAVSDLLYRAIVRHDHPGIDPTEYREVPFAAKEISGERVWIRVPGYYEPPGLPAPGTSRESGQAPPVGNAADPAGATRREAPAPAEAPPDAPPAGNSGIGTVHGGIHHGGIGVNRGEVNQRWIGATGADTGEETANLRRELERLRVELKEALRRREIDEETHRDAGAELDEAERHAEAAEARDEPARGRVLRALRRLKGLVEDVGGLAGAVTALINVVRGGTA